MPIFKKPDKTIDKTSKPKLSDEGRTGEFATMPSGMVEEVNDDKTPPPTKPIAKAKAKSNKRTCHVCGTEVEEEFCPVDGNAAKTE